MPKLRWRYLRRPTWVENVVMYLHAGASSSWWYSALRSSFENHWALFRFTIMSSIIGIMCHSRCIALLGRRMSMHKRTSPGCLGFGAITSEETQGVGPVTFSMTPSASSFFGSSSTLGLRWNGIHQFRSAMGLTVLSICNVICFPFSFPSPSNNCGKFLKMAPECESWTCRTKETRPRSSDVLQLSSVTVLPFMT